MGQSDIRIPPDSTGKRILHKVFLDIQYSNLISGIISIGDAITCNISGNVGVVQNIKVLSPTTGDIYIEVLNGVNEPKIGETFSSVGTSADGFATILLIKSIYTPTAILVGNNNAANGQHIDVKGAASVRFTEGEPQFDSYGLIRVSEPSRLASYTFEYDSGGTFFQVITGGTSSQTYLQLEKSVALDIGTDSGDRICITTHRYHKYSPAIGQLWSGIIAIGDIGKINVVRRWGYYDDFNGLFFELNGTTLNAVIRSNSTGSIVEIRVPIQNWNNDRLDGTADTFNASAWELFYDTKNNYFINFQNKAGGARFGLYTPNGTRVVGHTFANANDNSQPFISDGKLPVRIEMFNSGISSSPSRLKILSLQISREGKHIPDSQNNLTSIKSWVRPDTVAINTTNTVLISVRSASLYKGIINRKIIIPTSFHYYVTGEAVQITIMVSTVLSGAVWTQATYDSAAEFSNNGAVLFPGIQVGQSFLTPGVHKVSVSELFNSLGSNLSTLADGSAGLIYTFYAKTFAGGTTASIVFGIDWSEL